MLRQAASVLEGQHIGHVLLSGGVPAKDRRALVDRFRDDPDCRVFLSTNAGGTGLNLQVADTLINLDVPWNPAVLEQRIARVHRLGQHRPVQVLNFVTRDSIEERVLTTLGLKRNLFDGVFTGTVDEVSFAALGQRAFLDTVRGLVDEEPSARQESPPPTAPSATPISLAELAVQFLEAVAAKLGADVPGQQPDGAPAAVSSLVTTNPQTGQPVLQLPLPSPELLDRGSKALRTILLSVGPKGG
jgi:hypothetical protein